MLAKGITKAQEQEKSDISKPKKLFLVLLIVMVPVLLIIKQPDYGTALAFLVATVCMLFASGINKKYIIGAIVSVIIVIPLLYVFVQNKKA